MYGLVVRFELIAGHEGAFDSLAAKTIADIETSESGTLCYVSHELEGVPQARLFYEVYEDRAAFDAHEASEHIKSFLAERAQHLARPPEVWPLASGFGVARGRLATALGR